MKVFCFSLALLLYAAQLKGCSWRKSPEVSEEALPPPSFSSMQPQPTEGEDMKPPEPSTTEPQPEDTTDMPAPPSGGEEGGTSAPPGDDKKSGTTPSPRSGEKNGAKVRRETIELIRYDPRSDIGLANRYLDRLKSLQERRRYNEMRVYAGKLSRLMAYMEGHLPGVSLQVGLERVGDLLDKKESDKAAREIQRLATELRSLPTMAGSSEGDTLSALRDIAESLSDGGDVDTARESLNEIRISYPSGADPAALVREVRSSLTSLEIAIAREAPQVMQASLDTLRALLTKLGDALSTSPPPPQPQSPAGGATPPRT